ncbi:hypothetical protein J2W33_006614 [Variovorax boronicumulans]|nr:hypothetical protein [Variovorax boronicumulans]MDQ0045682.1 hypothetical protein [Variovorax boronicumulans]
MATPAQRAFGSVVLRSMRPSSTKRVSAVQLLSDYPIASAIGDFAETCDSAVFNQSVVCTDPHPREPESSRWGDWTLTSPTLSLLPN